jgi:transposase InsO family protein
VGCHTFGLQRSYLWTDEGWLYLAITLDLFNREVVGWLLKPRMTVDIVTDAPTKTWFRKRLAPGLTRHSNRDCQRMPAMPFRIRSRPAA